MTLPVQTPVPTQELTRLLKLVGRYRPELEEQIIPVIPLTLNDSFRVSVEITTAPAGASTSAFNDSSRITLLTDSAVFSGPLSDRGWVPTDVDMWLLGVTARAVTATFGNLSLIISGMQWATGEQQLLQRWDPTANVGSIISAAANQPLTPFNGLANNQNYQSWPILLPEGSHLLTKVTSNAGGATSVTMQWDCCVQLKGLRSPV